MVIVFRPSVVRTASIRYLGVRPSFKGLFPVAASPPDTSRVPVGLAPPMLFGVKLALWRNIIAARSVTTSLVDPMFPTSPPPQPLTMFQLKGMVFNRPRVVPAPQTTFKIIGVTRDNTGAALGNCNVFLFRTRDNVLMEQGTSDGSGNFSFSTVGSSTQYFIVAYKGGTPVRGTTDNTLIANA